MNLWKWLKSKSKTPIQKRKFLLAVELLEDRVQPSGLVESLDGTGNNLVHTTWGSAGTAPAISPAIATLSAVRASLLLS